MKKKWGIVALTIILIAGVFIFIGTRDPYKVNRSGQSKIQTALYNYMMTASNRASVRDATIKLNSGSQYNACAYFTSEALRRVGVDLPYKVNYTGKIKGEDRKDTSLTYQLEQRGWKVGKDVSKLLPGDVCFTTSDSTGAPTHVYIFMGWVKKGDMSYGYICDNQSKEYGTVYHVRNIKIAVTGKEAFDHFMYTE